MKKSIIIKTIIMIIVLVVFTGIDNAISPLVANNLAILQMSNSQDSSLWIQLYSYFSNYKFFIFIAFAILLYKKEISKLIKFISNKGEKVNEES